MTSHKNNTCVTAKTYAAVLKEPTTLAPSAMNEQPMGICTRGMMKKAAVNAAATSLRAAKVPKRPRVYSIESVIAAATALVNASSPTQEESEKLPTNSPSPMRPRKASPKKVINPATSASASVMTIGAKTIEEQMSEMMKLIDQLKKDNEEKNKKIEELSKEMEDLRNKDNKSQLSGSESEEEKEDEDEEPKKDDEEKKERPKNTAGDFNEKYLQG